MNTLGGGDLESLPLEAGRGDRDRGEGEESRAGYSGCDSIPMTQVGRSFSSEITKVALYLLTTMKSVEMKRCPYSGQSGHRAPRTNVS